MAELVTLALGVSIGKLLLRWADLNDTADALGDAQTGFSALKALRSHSAQDPVAVAISKKLEQRLAGVRDKERANQMKIAVKNVAAVFTQLTDADIVAAGSDPNGFPEYLARGPGRKLLNTTEAALTPFSRQLLDIGAEVFAELAPRSGRFTAGALLHLIEQVASATEGVSGLQTELAVVRQDLTRAMALATERIEDLHPKVDELLHRVTRASASSGADSPPHARSEHELAHATLATLREAARASTRLELDNRLNRFEDPSDYVPSEILTEWRKWLTAPTWRAQVDRHLTVLGINETALPRSALTNTYPTIHRRLREELKKWRDQQSGTQPESQEPAYAESQEWLMSQCDNPSYETCFCVAGRWGSGKSRMLVELSDGLSKSEQGYALFPKFENETVQRDIFESLRATFAVDISTMDQFVKFAELSLCSNIFIVIDDVHAACRRRPNFLSELQQTIEDSTRSTKIRWVMTANDADLEALANPGRANFWVPHGATSVEIQNAAGWLSLDRANTAAGTGFKILAERAGSLGAAERRIIERQKETFASEYDLLAQPGAAVLRAEQLVRGTAKPGLYADVNEASFVDLAWRNRLRHLSTAGVPAATLERVAAALARTCVTDPAWPLPEAALLSRLASALDTTHDAGRAVTVLERGGLLRRKKSAEFGGDAFLVFSDDSFWGLRLAEAFMHGAYGNDDPTAALLDSISDWLPRRHNSDGLRWSALQSTVAITSSEETFTNTFDRFVKKWVQGDFPLGPMLQGALAGATNGHHRAFRALRSKRQGVFTKRDRFALLRFIGAASGDTSAGRRFGQLQRHYADIGADGLGTYAQFVIETVFEDVSLLPRDGGLIAALHALVGCEEAGVSREAAKAASTAGVRVHNGLPGLIIDIGSFLAQPLDSDRFADSVMRVTRRRSLIVADWEGNGQEFDFWEDVIDDAADRAVREYGSATIANLNRLGWYTAQRRGNTEVVERALVRSVTRALGRWYQRVRQNPSERDAYVNLVRQMTSGRVPPLSIRQCRREAVYLIRHSEVTYGQRHITVDQDFHPLLHILSRDETARKSKHLRDMCLANKIEYVGDDAVVTRRSARRQS